MLELENTIEELTIEYDNTIQLYEEAIDLIVNRILEMKKFILHKGFKSVEDEIHFFKRLKPKVLSKLIYYNSLYKIETKMPYGGDKAIKKYINGELSKLKRYFDDNLEFYKYYRTNSNFLDHKYFLRGKHDVKLSLDTYYFESDHNFSTSHDYKVAKIIANDMIHVYLEDQLFKLGKRNKSLDFNSITWTGSKTALIELIYSLHAQSVFDHGNADIKIIAKKFENTFNIDLGDFYHTYLELRNRKTNRTKFLDSLKNILIKRMDEQDEK